MYNPAVFGESDGGTFHGDRKVKLATALLLTALLSVLADRSMDFSTATGGNARHQRISGLW